MQKIKVFLCKKRGMLITAMVAVMCCVSAFAEEPAGDSMGEITTALQSGFTQTAGDILKVIAIAVVAVMSVVGVKVAVKSAIKFFKSMSGG